MQKKVCSTFLKNIVNSLNKNQKLYFTKVFKDRETSIEKEYFTKEDEKTMKKLLQKLQKHTENVDKKETLSHHLEEFDKLKKIFNNNNVQNPPNDLLSEILAWKFTDD